MKKILVVGLVAFLVITAGGVKAQESEQNIGKDVLKERRLQLKESAKEELRKSKQVQKEEFRKNLQAIKDQKKRERVNKLNTQICELNKKRTTQLAGQLTKISQILDKAEARAKIAKSNGKDTAAFETAAANARAKVAEASKAVSDQADKACGVNLSGVEAKASSEVQAARLALEAEMKALQTKITEARKASSDAIVELAKAQGENQPRKVREEVKTGGGL